MYTHSICTTGSQYALQVVWVGKEDCSVTWEPEDKIPLKIIEEFEGKNKTIVAIVADCVTSTVGQLSHTLVPSHNTPSSSTSRPVVKDADGCIGCYYQGLIYRL